MPIGCSSFVPYIACALAAGQPKSILDLGAGMGFYGAVVRQWLDMGVRGSWSARLVGVEGFEAYRNPCWELYDEMEVTTIQDYLASSDEKFDMVIMLDVIEHFEHGEGERVLNETRKRLNPGGLFYVGTPGIWMDQGAAWGNSLETHRSEWSHTEFSDMGFGVLWHGHLDMFGHKMVLASAGPL